MTTRLTDLLSAGLIKDLAGDDERFAKIERATTRVATEFNEHPALLIDGILAGINPDVPATDPAIFVAKQALVSEWKTMDSVYPNAPIGLLRAILLAAAEQADAGPRPAIVWLTAADMLPLLRPGKEGPLIRRMLAEFATKTEMLALASASVNHDVELLPPIFPLPAQNPRAVDRDNLLLLVAAAAGPDYRNDGRTLPDPNPGWPTNATARTWSADFADRMHSLLADELEALSSELEGRQRQLVEQLTDALAGQQARMLEAVKSSHTRSQAEEVRLNVLWWSEALYSPALRRSYRDLPPPLAAVVMAIDLLDQVPKLTPASVAHLLAEVVHRLPGSAHDRKYELRPLLVELHAARGELPDDWSNEHPPRTRGRLSLRDLVFASISASSGNTDATVASAIHQAGLAPDVAISLPTLARAVFRQEQAVRLAGVVR